MNKPVILDNDLWGDTQKVGQSYYTVYVYKFSGLGNEATYENILADSAEDACERVGNSYFYQRNPKYAFKQEARIF